MRSILIAVLLSGVVLLIASSCATAPTEPLASGELRLLSMRQVPSQIIQGFPYDLIIIFLADGKPEISKACCSWSGGGPYSFKARNLRYGSPGNFRIELPPADPGQYTVECYAEYLRGGETQRTNVIDSVIDARTGGVGP